MKLKNNFTVFFISLAAILGFRLYEVINMNGSISTTQKVIEPVCLVCTLVFSFIIILMSYLSKNIPQKFKLSKNKFLSVLSFIAGIMLIINGVSDVLTLFMASTVEIILLFTGVLSILSGVIFFIIGKGFLSSRNMFLEHQLIILIPVVWFGARLYQVFSQYRVTVMRVEDISSEVFVIFMLLFFMHFARLMSGMYEQKVYKKLFMYGLSGSLFIFMSVTYVFLEMAVNTAANFNEVILAVTDLTLMIFVVSFVNSLGRNLAKKSDTAVEVKTDDNLHREKAEKQELPKQVKHTVEDSIAEANEETSEKFDMESIDKLIDEISN